MPVLLSPPESLEVTLILGCCGCLAGNSGPNSVPFPDWADHFGQKAFQACDIAAFQFAESGVVDLTLPGPLPQLPLTVF